MPKSDPPRKRRQFHRPERTVEVCYRGDLLAEIERLERDMQAVRSDAQTMGDRGRVRQLAEQVEQLRGQMQAETELWRLRGRSQAEWVALLGEHQPRDGNKEDELVGWNTDTFYLALIKACLIDPVIPEDELDELLAEMSSGQFEPLAMAALAVSRRKVDIPFSFAASATLSNSDGTSSPPSG